MNVQMLHFTANEPAVPAVEAAIAAMVDAIATTQPAGTRFAACKLDDGVTFLNVLELADGVANPMPGIPACQDFQRQLPGWVSSPPMPQPVTVVGSYRLFGP